jgi:hypothetical protein
MPAEPTARSSFCCWLASMEKAARVLVPAAAVYLAIEVFETV